MSQKELYENRISRMVKSEKHLATDLARTISVCKESESRADANSLETLRTFMDKLTAVALVNYSPETNFHIGMGTLMFNCRRLFIGLFVLVNSCVSVADLPKPVNISGSIPEDTRSLAIRVAPSKPEVLNNAGGLVDAAPFLARYIRDAVALKRPDWQVKILEPGSPTAESDLIASIEVASIDGGSAGLRFWIGFSAGATESTVAISLLGKGAKELAQATITERTMCPIGACIDSNENSIQRNLKSLAGEIASFITDPAAYKNEK
jgi:hypothetical protein